MMVDISMDNVDTPFIALINKIMFSKTKIRLKKWKIRKKQENYEIKSGAYIWRLK